MTTTTLTKTSRTVDQRIKQLEDRNLKISNYALFKDYIENHTTYYHLIGYRFVLQNYNSRNDDYNMHNSNELMAAHRLDILLSDIFFSEIRTIEQAIRARLANICGEDDMVTLMFDKGNKTAVLQENYCNNINSNLIFFGRE